VKLYVSGPMTGIPEHNFPAFNAAAAALRAAGFEVVNPADNGADPTGQTTWADYLRKDLVDMLGCKGLALLDGWHRSKGARLEYHVASELAMPIRSVDAWLLTAEVSEPTPLLNVDAEEVPVS